MPRRRININPLRPPERKIFEGAFDPLAGVRAAVCRRAASGEELGDDQTVSAEQALEMYTLHAARAGGLEHEVGTLEPGKRADLVVLNCDPTTLEPHELTRLAVVRTVCGGADAYVCSA